jgi:hypothetical protein
VNPKTETCHVQKLLGEAGAPLFPESATQASISVAMAIVFAFADPSLFRAQGTSQIRRHRPWKLVTNDAELGAAVSDVFENMGVETRRIEVAPDRVYMTGKIVFDQYFRGLKDQVQPLHTIEARMFTPAAISPFHPLNASIELEEQAVTPESVLACITHQLNSVPPTTDERKLSQNLRTLHAYNSLYLSLNKVPTMLLKINADRGNPDNALEYGLR